MTQFKIIVYLSILLKVIQSGGIYSSRAEVKYSYDGKPTNFRFNFALQSGLGPNCYIQLYLPVDLGIIVQSTLINNSTMEKQTLPVTFQTLNNRGYLFIQVQGVNKNQWYTLSIDNNNPSITPGFYKDPIEIQTVSDISLFQIIYDINLAFDVLYLITPPTETLQVAHTYTDPNKNKVGQQNNLLRLNITIGSLTVPTYIALFIEINASGYSFSTQCAMESFNFTCSHFGSAKIMKFVPNVLVNSSSKLNISLYVNNPNYAKNGDLLIYYYEINGGQPVNQVIQTVTKSLFFDVPTISIVQLPYKILFDIDYNLTEVASLPLDFKIYRQADNYHVYNNIKFPFYINQLYQPSPGYTLDISILLGQAENIIPLSINHNLPSSETPVQCKVIQILTNKFVTCSNVGQLQYGVGSIYSISLKVRYNVDTLVNFGQISIKSGILSVFTQTAGYSVTLSQTSSFLESSSWTNHMANTQVISVLEESVYDANVYYNKAFDTDSYVTGIGVFPNRDSKQSLIFFLNIGDISSLLTTTTGVKQIIISILFNKNMITFQEPYSLGLGVAGTDGLAHSFSNTVCSKHSLCHDYDGSNNKKQYSPSLGYYTLVCANPDGTYNSNCNELLRGYSSVSSMTSKETVLIMRNVILNTFSGAICDDKQLDFVVSVYEMTTSLKKIKSSVVHAYALSNIGTRNTQSLFQTGFVNYRFGAVKDPDSPTFMRIKFNLNDIGNERYDRIGIFLDAGLSMDYVEDATDEIGQPLYACNTICSSYPSVTYSGVSSSDLSSANYLQNNAIIIQNEYMVEDLLIPVSTSLNNNLNFNYMHIALMMGGQIVKVWTIAGPQTGYGPLYQVPSSELNMYRFGSGSLNSIQSYTISSWKYLATVNSDSLIFSHSAVDSSSESYSNYVGSFTSGFLIISKGVNIFQEQDINIQEFGGLIKCLKFKISLRYGVFCPTELISGDIFGSDSSVTEISISSSLFTNGLQNPMGYIFFSLSDVQGISKGYHYYSNTIGNKLATCYIFDPPTHPMQNKFNIAINYMSQIPIDVYTVEGYGGLTIIVTADSTNTQKILQTNFELSTKCVTDGFYCVVNSQAWQSSFSFEIQLTATATSPKFVSESIIQVFLSSLSIGKDIATSAIVFKFQVVLPKKIASVYSFYGSINDNALIYQECTGTLNFSSLKLTGSLEILQIKYETPTLGAMGQIQIDFGFKNYLGPQVMEKDDELHITWGFLAEANSYFRCIPYLNNSLNFDFQSFEITAFSQVGKGKLKVRNQIDYIKSTIISLRCLGGVTPNPTTPQPIQIQWISGVEIMKLVDNSVFSSWANQNFTKKTSQQLTTPSISGIYINSPGFDSNYVFEIKCASDLTSDSAIFVEFSIVISPLIRWNDGGVTCQIGPILTFCNVVQERRIRIQIFEPMVANSLIPITIGGVTKSRLASSQVWIGVSIDGNFANGVDYMSTILQVLSDIPKFDASMTYFNIINASIIQTAYRTPTTHIIYMSSTSSILSNTSNSFYIDGFFDQSTYKTTPSCSLINKQNVECAQSCSFQSQTVLSVEARCVNVSSSELMKLTLSNMPYYVRDTLYNNPYLPRPGLSYRVYKLNSLFQIQAYGAWYSDKAVVYPLRLESGKQNVEWDFEIAGGGFVSVPLGYMSTVFRLKPVDNQKFLSSFNVQIAPDKTEWEYFVIKYSYKRAYMNDDSISFQIGANDGTARGMSQLYFDKTGGDEISNPPYINVLVQQKPCSSIKAEFSAYYVPYQGQSIPIKLNFSECMPLQALKVTARLDNTLLGSFYNQTLELVYDPMSKDQNVIYFTLNSSTILLESTTTTTLNFQLSGQNLYLFKDIPPVTITVYKDLSTIETVYQPVITQPDKSITQLIIGCNTTKEVRLYYYFSIFNPYIQYLQADVINYLLTSNSYQIPNDPYGTSFGTVTIPAAKNTINLILDKLVMGRTYLFSAYCMNLYQLNSSFTSINITVPQLDQSILKLVISYKGLLKIADIRNLTCAVSTVLKIDRSNVVTDDLIFCDNYLEKASIATQPVVRRSLQLTDNTNYETLSLQNIDLISEKSINIFIKGLNIYNNLNQVSESDSITQQLYSTYFFDYLSQNIDAFKQQAIISEIEVQRSIGNNIPTIVRATSYVDYQNFNFDILTSYYDGYILCGLDAIQISTPSISNLRKGLNGLSIPLINYQMVRIAKNVQFNFIYDQLSDDIDYQFYFILSSDDPSIYAIYQDQVTTIQFKVEKKWSIPDIFGSKLKMIMTNLIIILIIFIL